MTTAAAATEKKSEGIHNMIEFVKVKKTDGTLYLMDERIAWMPNGKNSFTISHNYADIKTQKISPEGKPKVQLQVVLGDNTTDIFHFAHPEPKKQLEDRNEVKEFLMRMLPLHRRKISKEMEHKWKLLNSNPKLNSLYKTLVVSNVITGEKFWENQMLSRSAFSKLPVEDIVSTVDKVGVSSAFLADVKPQSDGSNGIHYNITSEIIEAIFQTYPAVKRKHYECVPNKLTEEEFWQRFFQSHYFHRDRISSMKDFFNDCARQDEADIQNAIKKGITDPFFDLRVFDDQVEPTLENVIGEKELNSGKQELSANQALIRRFNFHSIMVLDACRSDEEKRNPLLAMLNDKKTKEIKKEKTEANQPPPPPDPAELEEEARLEEARGKAKKRRLLESIEYDDLEGKRPAIGVNYDDFIENNEVNTLAVTHEERYQHGPTPLWMVNDGYNNGSGSGPAGAQVQAVAMLERLSSCVKKWKPLAQPIIDSHQAIHTVTDLSPGGVLWKKEVAGLTMGGTNLRDELPKDVMAELKQLSMALDELLFHFWKCVPLANDTHEKKFIEVRDTLERFQFTKLQPFHERVSREVHRDLTSHLMNKLEAAYSRFRTWQAKRPFNKSGKTNVR